MKRIFSTLLNSAVIGLACGVLSGFARGMQIYSNALAKTQGMNANEAASYLCGAGSAPVWLAVIGAPAGAFFGLSICGLMLLFRAATGKNRLP